MKLGYLVSFSFGAVLGGVASAYFLRAKFQAEADAQIESVKKTFMENWAGKEKPSEPPKEEDPNKDLKKDIRTVKNFNTYEHLVRNYGKPETIQITSEEPRVIGPEEFGDNEEYSEVSYYYFSDGVVTDENFEQVEDLDDMIGPDALTCFGIIKGDPDTVYVCNDRIRCYIEILRDLRSYEKDIKPTMPRHGDE